MQEFNFDKFMEDIDRRTAADKKRREQLKKDEAEHPRRKLLRKTAEHPAHMIRYDK